MDHFEKLQNAVRKGDIPERVASIVNDFYISYGEAIEQNGFTIKELQPLLNTFLDRVIDQLKNPHLFTPYHEAVTSPFDYYHFANDLLRPLVVFEKSTIHGLDQVDIIQNAIKKGENVILLANHQTEPDPQAISLLLENTHPQLAMDMIFVAGQRVINDPLAVPMSLGRNLLCIYSKRHMDADPESKREKQQHNQNTMIKMSHLLKDGGKCIYVAPSGGRDRRDSTGRIAIAPFDPQSVEMFLLMAKHAGVKTHFHTLALATHHLLPPPNSIEKELGEKRETLCTPIHLSFGSAVDIDHLPGSDCTDKTQRRQIRADFLWKRVADMYAQLPESNEP